MQLQPQHTLTNPSHLRFSDYKDSWTQYSMKDLGEFMGGGTPSKSVARFWNGSIPWISSSDISDASFNVKITRFITEEAIDKSATKKIPKGSLLIVSRVGVGKLAVNDADICTSQDFTNFIPKEGVDVIFMAYSVKRKSSILASFNQGTSIKGFTKDDLANLTISIPTISEQHKIASFLSSVDKWIENLQLQKSSLEKYKKGMMQKLFSQKIRFKDKKGSHFPEWEEKSFGDVFERIIEKNLGNNKNVLTISAQHGLINQEDFFNKSVAAKSLLKYYLLYKGDFAYNKSYSNGYPMGAIKKLNIYDKGIVSSLYICFRTKQGNFPDFYEQYFNAGLQNREIEKIAQEGARNHGLLNISVVDFFVQLFLQVPSYPEQQKIADFLNSIDVLILLKAKQLKYAEQWKKGLLQKMLK